MFDAQVALLALPDDIAIAFGAEEDGGEAARALALARAHGYLTIAFSQKAGAEYEFAPPTRGTRTSARSWSKRSTTCCGSWCTCSSTTAGCSPGAPAAPSTMPARRASSTPSSASRERELEPVVADIQAVGDDEGAARVARFERKP